MTMEQRCDGVVDCRDKSDEVGEIFINLSFAHDLCSAYVIVISTTRWVAASW